MGKTIKGKDKAKAKKAAMQKKIARKCKKASLAALFITAGIVLCGCSTTGPQPSRAMNQWNRFENCTFTANAGKGTEPVEIFTQTQANEGNETVSPTATPTNTVDVPITVKYNDAISGATAASRSVLGTIGDGIEGVLSLMQSKESGKVVVTKVDGTKACVECKDGQCSYCKE